MKTDDVEAYNKHIQRLTAKFNPAGDDERAVLQDLADTEWRLLRIAPLEAGILALGRIELAPLFAAYTDEPLPAELLEAKVFMVYRKDLNNLSLQQIRLPKHRESITAELAKLQQDRNSKVNRERHAAALSYEDAIAKNWPFNPHDFGFEFTLDQMFEEIALRRAQKNCDMHPEITKKVYI